MGAGPKNRFAVNHFAILLWLRLRRAMTFTMNDRIGEQSSGLAHIPSAAIVHAGDCRA
jgi:hypothetical protein